MSVDSLESLVPAARAFLHGRIRRTPLEPSPELTRILGVPVSIKLENLQLTGSFKIRGAWFRLSLLSPAERERGVLTCSAGNHGKALAFAGRELGVPVVVCVPNSVDPVKLRAIEALGAELRVAPYAGYDAAEEWAQAQAEAEALPFVSAFDEPAIMAGNGATLAAEVLEDAPEARIFATPIGGGGLGAGFAWQLERTRPASLFIGCQHEGSPALALSLERGAAVTRLPPIETLAGGVEGGIGRSTFELLKGRVGRVVLVREDEIGAALRWMVEHHQYVIEPTAAVALAACLSGRLGPVDAPLVLVVTGRNVGLPVLRELLC